MVISIPLIETKTEILLGRISAHLWVEEGDVPTGAGIMLNSYARVIGAVRQQQDTKSIMIYKIRPVKSINEVNTHYLEVINARYQAEEYYRGNNDGAGDIKMETASQVNAAVAGTQGPTGKSLAIFKVIQASGSANPDRGISIQELCSKFAHISAAEMRSIIDNMSGEGHIYSTIDSDHFVSCF